MNEPDYKTLKEENIKLLAKVEFLQKRVLELQDELDDINDAIDRAKEQDDQYEYYGVRRSDF